MCEFACSSTGAGRRHRCLEKEYSPSLSSHRAADNAAPNDLIKQFEQALKAETTRVKRIYNLRPDVKYGETQRESMDIYFKDREEGTPILVYVHGGYWISLDKSSSGIFVAPFVERGYRVIAVDYNLCPRVKLETQVEQMKGFGRFLLQYAAETRARRISLCGHSAGAHLITTLLQPEIMDLPNANLIEHIFLISGLYDLRELYRTEAGNPANALSLPDEESAAQLSPILYTFPESLKKVRIHVMAAEHDSATFKKQSEDFFNKLGESDIPTFHMEFPEYDHFTIIEEMRSESSRVTNYMLYALDLLS